MPVSQNGWSANDRSVITSFAIGNQTKVSLRAGDAGTVLQHFANWFDINIQDIDFGQLDDWGYAERPIRGSKTVLSNHASGTALDLNATKWSLGSSPKVNLNDAQIAKVHAQLAFYEGVIRWGGDYDGRLDPMHFEINSDAAGVARIAAKIRGIKPQGPVRGPGVPDTGVQALPVLRLGSNGTLVKQLQAFFNKNYPAYSNLTVDGDFGARTDWVVKEFQRRSGLTPDGVVGARTWSRISL